MNCYKDFEFGLNISEEDKLHLFSVCEDIDANVIITPLIPNGVYSKRNYFNVYLFIPILDAPDPKYNETALGVISEVSLPTICKESISESEFLAKEKQLKVRWLQNKFLTAIYNGEYERKSRSVDFVENVEPLIGTYKIDMFKLKQIKVIPHTVDLSEQVKPYKQMIPPETEGRI